MTDTLVLMTLALVIVAQVWVRGIVPLKQIEHGVYGGGYKYMTIR